MFCLCESAFCVFLCRSTVFLPAYLVSRKRDTERVALLKRKSGYEKQREITTDCNFSEAYRHRMLLKHSILCFVAPFHSERRNKNGALYANAFVSKHRLPSFHSQNESKRARIQLLPEITVFLPELEAQRSVPVFEIVFDTLKDDQTSRKLL